MRIDFNNVDTDESYASVPDGTYVCRVRDVKEALSREGSPRWWYRLEVAEGEYAGRTAALDGLTFSEKGLRRVKGVLQRMGFDTSGVLDLTAADLEGVLVRVSVATELREEDSGRRVERMRVPYMGYEPVELAGSSGSR